MGLPIGVIRELIIGAWKRKDKENAWQLYVNVYPTMNNETYISFQDFYAPKKVDVRTEEEILSEVKDIIDMFGGE